MTETGCWIWLGPTNTKGYGTMRGSLAHRWSYRAFRGPIAKGMNVNHRCDVRPCVNPDHLWVGNQADNVKDMDDKGRSNRIGQKPGESHPLAKLTWDQVRSIRSEHTGGKSTKRLALKYGVGVTQINRIVRNLRWKEAA